MRTLSLSTAHSSWTGAPRYMPDAPHPGSTPSNSRLGPPPGTNITTRKGEIECDIVASGVTCVPTVGLISVARLAQGASDLVVRVRGTPARPLPLSAALVPHLPAPARPISILTLSTIATLSIPSAVLRSVSGVCVSGKPVAKENSDTHTPVTPIARGIIAARSAGGSGVPFEESAASNTSGTPGSIRHYTYAAARCSQIATHVSFQ